ncbi:2-dehydropantoate 2-reductase [Actimicrobium sp. GrIS 1.19]|uniref:2-dehydropantoate 2-reductase n=1 Tax=Actimicrobium sp. GrIS 1.19 TaxID=3071708 RepID=UPI002E00FB7F|nr:2-dehydropantoate 2-reductase [Actimicrobium sp. GrIS 1.19]
MKITVIGAGAVGGLIAARLARHQDGLSMIARGRTLDAINTHGLRIDSGASTVAVKVRAESDPARLGVQDLVVVAVKATGLADVATQIHPLLGPDTIVLSAMNGVPWWFFENPAVPHAGMRLDTLDATGALRRAIPVQQIIGCVVHLTCSAPEPGMVRPGFGNRLIVGEALGGLSTRLAQVAALLNQAGFDADAGADIRSDIWYKLWGNMTMNPLSAITGATCDKLLDDPLVRALCLKAMQEATVIGAEIGCPIAQSGEERMQLTRKLGAFKTSMLQDVEAGKGLEIDALIGAVHEIGQRLGIATPNIDSLFGLVRLFARTRGLYPD